MLEAWGRSDSVEGLEFAALAVLEAVIDSAAAIKPQVAYFERFGSQGYQVLERLIKEELNRLLRLPFLHLVGTDSYLLEGQGLGLNRLGRKPLVHLVVVEVRSRHSGVPRLKRREVRLDRLNNLAAEVAENRFAPPRRVS